MSALEVVKDRYFELDPAASRKGDQRAAIEVKYKGRVEKWTSNKLGRLTLDGFDAGNEFELAQGRWHSVGAALAKVDTVSELHLSQVYDRILPMLETVLANNTDEKARIV